MIMSQLPPCPQCSSEYTYEDGVQLVCPECGHEWTEAEQAEAASGNVGRHASGNELHAGDKVTGVEDLKVKGSRLVVRVGTREKNIRLVEGDHDIDCKVDGVGAM